MGRMGLFVWDVILEIVSCLEEQVCVFFKHQRLFPRAKSGGIHQRFQFLQAKWLGFHNQANKIVGGHKHVSNFRTFLDVLICLFFAPYFVLVFFLFFPSFFLSPFFFGYFWMFHVDPCVEQVEKQGSENLAQLEVGGVMVCRSTNSKLRRIHDSFGLTHIGHLGIDISSGKHTKNYGKVHHFIAGKINYLTMAIFNSYVKLPEGTMTYQKSKLLPSNVTFGPKREASIAIPVMASHSAHHLKLIGNPFRGKIAWDMSPICV